MPRPAPKGQEDRQSFVSRCVSDNQFKLAHPDKDERIDRCYTIWQRSKEKDD